MGVIPRIGDCHGRLSMACARGCDDRRFPFLAPSTPRVMIRANVGGIAKEDVGLFQLRKGLDPRIFLLEPLPAAIAFAENVSAAAWKTKPSWYLVATADRAIQPDLERAMAKTIKAKTIEVDASHVAMLARPQETANLILEGTA
jgi:pimeloyl-ACP methyl ester carboxylesterase